MIKENDEWILYGINWTDKNCFKSPKKVIEYINKIGFLPLFKNEIEGFSLEERTDPVYWWTGDVRRDPWQWREIIARSKEVFYGKFFNKKAGFISKEYFSYFANYKRDGYDFDALWDDGKASRKEKCIMDLFSEESDNLEYLSTELKSLAGFSKSGLKGFESTIINLQTHSYICVADFRQRKNKLGQYYGWPVAVYTTPENITNYSDITSKYKESSSASKDKIIEKIQENFDADEKIIIKLL